MNRSPSAVRFEGVGFSYGPEYGPVFDSLNLEIPAGVTSLAGQNGTGKSTLLLLAAGRLKPTAGQVWLGGRDTAGLTGADLDRAAAVVYQNMEFETEDKLGDVLEFVFANGYADHQALADLPRQVIEVFELGKLLGRPTQVLAKGEMQRAVMAFAVLYGSETVVMDEPVFALEQAQKHRALDFVGRHARQTGRSFLYSAHELELTQKYSDHLLLFYKDRPPVLGPTGELFQRQPLEDAYQVPWDLLHKRESLLREALQKQAISPETAKNSVIR